MHRLFLFALFVSTTAFAGLVEDGENAWGNGEEKKAAEYWQKACDQSNFEGCGNLGYLYERNWHIGRDLGKAQQLYEKACNGGYLLGCSNLASLFYEDVQYSDDNVAKGKVKKAVDLWESACNKGLGVSCYLLGNVYLTGAFGHMVRDVGKTKKLYIRACEKGYAKACYELAALHHENTYSAERTIEYYRNPKDSIEKRMLAEAQDALKENQRQAVKFYALTCKHGGAPACDKLGKAYENGKFGLKKDLKKAKYYYDQCYEVVYKKGKRYDDFGGSCEGSEHLK